MSAQPDYVSFEPKGRDEVLSQIGSFSPSERDLFQRLCDSWEPRIDARQFIRSAEKNEKQERSALERLMAKLRTAELGVLTTKPGESGAEPDEIVLTSKGSLEFWTVVVEQAIERIVRSRQGVLPSVERIRAHKSLPPDYHVVEADSSQFLSAYSGNAEPQTVYRLRLLGDYRILFTLGTARAIVARALAVLRRDLDERGIVEELARIRDTTMTEIRSRLESRAPDVWLELTQTVVKERSTIVFRKNMEESDELFQLAYLVMVYTDARIGAAREQKANDELIAAELARIDDAVREVPAGMLSQDEFSSLVESAQDRVGNASAALLSRRLSDELLTPRPRRKLSRVLFVHGVYIHNTRVSTAFESARSEMSTRLTREYTELMEAFLRGRAPEIGEVFGSRDRFNEDIGRRIGRQNPLLSELLSQPQIVAEAVIVDTRQRYEEMPTEEIRGFLGRYFDVQSSSLKPLNELLALNVAAMFDAAFARVGVLRQIFLRLSGRYESLRSSYSRRFGTSNRSAGSLGALDRTGSRASRVSSLPSDGPLPDDAPGTYETGSGARGSGGTASSRRRSAPRPARPRPKSRQEIDRIWKDFDKALHTKPSEE
ncbi:MAG: hypothetical protein ACOC2Y_01905 [Spirochaetota bacterium]